MTSSTVPFFEITPDYGLLIRMTRVNYNEQNPSFIFPSDQYTDLAGDYGDDVESRLRDPEPLRLSKPLVLSGFFDVLPAFDYLPVQLTLPIVSRRMLDILNRVNPITADVVSVRIVDNADPDVLFKERTFASDNRAAGHRHSDDYVLLRLTQRLDLSEMGGKGRPARRQAELALPAVFRQQGEVGIFVSAAARAALVDADIKGCDFSLPGQFRSPTPS